LTNKVKCDIIKTEKGKRIPDKRKELKNMRVCTKRVYNKVTGQMVFASQSACKADEFIAKQATPSDFVVCYHWWSI
jgi:hypothetical protein